MKRSEWNIITQMFETVKTKYNDLENKVDSLGKVQQTATGNGTYEDPYKVWNIGMPVQAGKWYVTYDDYLWQAIKTGTPVSSTDREFFDVVGL